jgi:hypothetical protein
MVTVRKSVVKCDIIKADKADYPNPEYPKCQLNESSQTKERV